MKIGFTVGVYDLLHEGHINALKYCKAHCDYLHVGIMNSYWCSVQKGHERPIQSLPLRMAALRQCEYVDNIVILDTLDMHPYLQMSDIWFKGVDQKNMRPFEYGNIMYVPRTPDVSTTELIRKRQLLNG